MKAVRIHEHGGPEVLRIEELPVPSPGDGEALIRVQAIGVNYIDVYQRGGVYPIPLPSTAGQEAAGTVVALGPGVTDVAVGERVAYAGVAGAYAEYAAVPAARLVRLPDGVSAREGAAALLQGLTAHYLASTTFPLGPGDSCLVHAAAGGVGLLLCQMARLRGARVIGTVSSEEKAALARAAGAHEVILYTRVDFAREVQRITDGKRVQVVYDSVGRSTFDGSLACLARRGMLVLFGQSSGPVPAFDPRQLAAGGSLFLTRPVLHDYVVTSDELRARAGEVLAWIRDRRVALRLEHDFALADAAEAHRALEGRRTTGKLLLIP